MRFSYAPECISRECRLLLTFLRIVSGSWKLSRARLDHADLRAAVGSSSNTRSNGVDGHGSDGNWVITNILVNGCPYLSIRRRQSVAAVTAVQRADGLK